MQITLVEQDSSRVWAQLIRHDGEIEEEFRIERENGMTIQQVIDIAHDRIAKRLLSDLQVAIDELREMLTE